MSFLETITKYLQEKGWYWDEEHFVRVWERASEPKDRLRYHCWTVPQWEAYWNKPYWDDPTHENYGSKPTRRYESLEQAIMSQVLREEQPEEFAIFFRDNSETEA